MEISVVIPAYNAENFIRTAVESALQQPEVSEVILVEDKSTDDTLKVCIDLERQYAKVSLYQHPDKKNHGAGASRNLGILKSNTEFIAFLDADDYYLPDRFQKERELLANNPLIDGVYSALGFHYYNREATSVETDNAFKQANLTTLSGRVEPGELLYVLLGVSEKSKGYFSIVALTVRKRIFDIIGYFDTSLKLSQDTQLIIKMATKGILVSGSITEPVAMRGVHSHNRSTNRKNLIQFRKPLYESLYKWGRENDMPAKALIACHDKYLMWGAYHNSFLRNIGFLISMPRKNPRLFRNNAQFSEVVFATFGDNLLARIVIKLKVMITRENL